MMPRWFTQERSCRVCQVIPPVRGMTGPMAGSIEAWVLNLCREAGFEAQVIKLADGPASVLELVSSGFGVALLPGLFQRFPSDVVFRPLPPKTPRFQLSLAWRRDNESPVLKAFQEILRKRFGEADS